MSESIKVKISQTVLLNISDHWTRNRIQNGTSSFRVVGALLGKTEGRVAQILSSTELDAQITPDMDEFKTIDEDYMNNKVNLLKQVFNEYEFVGWYFTYTPLHNTISNQDKNCHKSFMKFTENPILLTLGFLKNPWNNMKQNKELSLTCYEINKDVQHHGEEVLVPISHEIEMDKAEATTIQSVRLTLQKTDRSQFAQFLYPIDHSLELLSSYLKKILTQIIPHPEFAKNEELVNELSELLGKFPREALGNDKLIDAGFEAIIVDLLTMMGAAKGTIDYVMEQRAGFSKGDLNQIE